MDSVIITKITQKEKKAQTLISGKFIVFSLPPDEVERELSENTRNSIKTDRK